MKPVHQEKIQTDLTLSQRLAASEAGGTHMESG